MSPPELAPPSSSPASRKSVAICALLISSCPPRLDRLGIAIRSGSLTMSRSKSHRIQSLQRSPAASGIACASHEQSSDVLAGGGGGVAGVLIWLHSNPPQWASAPIAPNGSSFYCASDCGLAFGVVLVGHGFFAVLLARRSYFLNGRNLSPAI